MNTAHKNRTSTCPCSLECTHAPWMALPYCALSIVGLTRPSWRALILTLIMHKIWKKTYRWAHTIVVYWGCSFASGCGCGCVCGWRDSCQKPTNEFTNVGWVFNEQNMEHLDLIFREHTPCSDSLDIQPTLVTNAGLNSKQLQHWWPSRVFTLRCSTNWPIWTWHVYDAHLETQSQPTDTRWFNALLHVLPFTQEMRSESDSVRFNLSMFMSRQPQLEPKPHAQPLASEHPQCVHQHFHLVYLCFLHLYGSS